MVYKKKYEWLLLVILGALFLPYVFISQYAMPYADDFVYGFRGKNYPILQENIKEYFTWGGRYSANMFYFINPISFNSFTGYKLTSVLWICLTAGAWLLFIHVLIGRYISKTQQLICALFIALLFLYQLPILSEGIYWYTGAVTYQVGNIALLVYLSTLVSLLQARYVFKSRFFHLLMLTLCLIVCLGFNEIQMLALAIFATGSLFIVYKKTLANKKLFIYLFVVTLIFSCVLFFSPGSAARGEFAVNNHRFFPSLFFSAAQTIRFFLEWTSSLPLLALSVLYYYLNRKLVEKNQLFAASFYVSPRYSISFLFLIIFIAVFPPYWATGILGQHRTLNVAYSLFLILWFINLTVCFNSFNKELQRINPIQKTVYMALIVIAVVGIAFSKNGYDILTDLLYGKASKYEAQLSNRYELLKTAQDTIYFDPVFDPPKTLFLYDISTDPTGWINQCYNVYFELGDKKIIKQKN